MKGSQKRPKGQSTSFLSCLAYTRPFQRLWYRRQNSSLDRTPVARLPWVNRLWTEAHHESPTDAWARRSCHSNRSSTRRALIRGSQRLVHFAGFTRCLHLPSASSNSCLLYVSLPRKPHSGHITNSSGIDCPANSALEGKNKA